MRRRRVIVALFLAVTALVIALLLRSRGSKRGGTQAKAAPADVPAAAPAVRPQVNAHNLGSLNGYTPVPSGVPASAKLIHEVQLSNPEPCAGEPISLTIAARDPDSADKAVYTTAFGQHGSPLVFSFTAPAEIDIPIHAYRTRGGEVGDESTVKVRVRNCGQHEFLEVRPVPLSPNVYGLAVRPRVQPDARPAEDLTGDAAAFDAYEWELGDGQVRTTAEPSIEHDFSAQRPRDRIEGNVLVRVTAKRRSGKPLVGMASIYFYNNYVRNKLEASVIMPPVRVEMPARADGAVTATLVVDSAEPGTLQPRTVQVSEVPCDPAQEPTVSEVPAHQLFATTSWGEGQTRVPVRIQLSKPDATLCRVVLLVKGGAPAPYRLELSTAVVLADPAGQKLSMEGASAEQRDKLRLVQQALVVLGRQHDRSARVTEQELEWLLAQRKIH